MFNEQIFVQKILAKVKRMDIKHALGINADLDNTKAHSEEERKRLQLYINLKLHSSGLPGYSHSSMREHR